MTSRFDVNMTSLKLYQGIVEILMNTNTILKSTDHTNTLFTPEDAANFLSIHIVTLAKWRSSGSVSLTYVKVGRAIRYRKSDLEKFLDENSHV